MTIYLRIILYHSNPISKAKVGPIPLHPDFQASWKMNIDTLSITDLGETLIDTVQTEPQASTDAVESSQALTPPPTAIPSTSRPPLS